VRSIREHEEREQMGTLVSPFTQMLIDVEKQCLVRLSQGARESQQAQIALNAIVRAQKLEPSASFDVSQEFASVLWLQNEQKLAVQLLDNLLHKEAAITDRTQKALLLSRLVSNLF
jgi:serine-protein kinase ATM